MKNKDFNACWDGYVQALSDVNQKRARALKKIIEQFEDNGFDVSCMTYSESLILLNMLASKLTYSSLVTYCAVYNGYIKLMRDLFNKPYQKLFPIQSTDNSQLYTSESDFLSDIELQLNRLTDRAVQKIQLTESEAVEYQNNWLSAIVYLILSFYGLSTTECLNVKTADIDIDHRTITITRDNKIVVKQFSPESWEYIVRYKNLTRCTHFWVHTVVVALPDTGYLFKQTRTSKNQSNRATEAQLTSTRHQFTTKSNIKRWLGLSGAFINYKDKVTDPIDLCEHVHKYLGDGVISDMNIKKHWKDFLKLEQVGEDN